MTFEAPPGAERAARLLCVLQMVYLIFNEGYAATVGTTLSDRACARKRSGSVACWPG